MSDVASAVLGEQRTRRRHEVTAADVRAVAQATGRTQLHSPVYLFSFLAYVVLRHASTRADHLARHFNNLLYGTFSAFIHVPNMMSRHIHAAKVAHLHLISENAGLRPRYAG